MKAEYLGAAETNHKSLGQGVENEDTKSHTGERGASVKQQSHTRGRAKQTDIHWLCKCALPHVIALHTHTLCIGFETHACHT